MAQNPPPLINTPDEIQRDAKRSAIKRSVFFIRHLMTLDFASLVRRVERISQEYSRHVWYKTALNLQIDIEALEALDACEPPIPYPHFFCTPDILTQHPALVTYYRNVAMVSEKAMHDMGLDTASYAAGQVPTPDVAANIARCFNRIISALVTTGG